MKTKKKRISRRKSIPCFKGICVSKSSYKITTTLLKELLHNSSETKQTPILEIVLTDLDNVRYKMECKITKIV